MTLRVAWFGHAAGRRADGLSTYSAQTVTALERLGCTVRFFHHDLDGEICPTGDVVTLRARRFKTVTLPRRHGAEIIERELREFRPDVVHCSWSFSLLDGEIGRMGRALGAATVATFHVPYNDGGGPRSLVMRGLYRYHRHNLAEYDRCIALSDGQRRLLIDVGLDPDAIVRLHNAVDTEALSPGPSRLRDRLGAELVVAYVGRLDPEKRVPALVESFVRRRWPRDRVLVIAGAGSQETRLRRRCEGLPNVHLLGLVTDPDERLDVLRAADVFVLPSTAEGLALSLLEAMSVGAAVICTDAGEDGPALGDAGILVPTRPLEPALSDALERLATDPAERRRLGAAARERARELFGLERHAQQLLGIYRDLVNTPTSRRSA